MYLEIIIEFYSTVNRRDQTKKNETGGACSMYGGEESCVQGFGREI
jgi:hypothetical protein